MEFAYFILIVFLICLAVFINYDDGEENDEIF